MFIKGELHYGWTIWKIRGKDVFCIRKDNLMYYEKTPGKWKEVKAKEEFYEKLPLYRFSDYNSRCFRDVKDKYLDMIKRLSRPRPGA
tara:strand:+ start:140 stop:400 length:261 start_codon:yes stop_codon:yes gene_type:complete